MNNQNRKDLSRRSGVTGTVLDLLRRAPGLDLLDFNEGQNRTARAVPAGDDGGSVAVAINDGYELERIDPVSGDMIFGKLLGLFYPVPSRFGRA